MEPVEKTYIVNVMSIQANIFFLFNILTASRYLSVFGQNQMWAGLQPEVCQHFRNTFSK